MILDNPKNIGILHRPLAEYLFAMFPGDEIHVYLFDYNRSAVLAVKDKESGLWICELKLQWVRNDQNDPS